MHVNSIITRKGDRVATIEGNQALGEAIEMLRAEGVGALVVSADGRRISGIISERDIVRRLAADGAGALDHEVSAAMTTEVVTCRLTDSVEALMRLMTDRRIRHVPVVDDAEQLGGIISIGDVVKARLTELVAENEALAGYVANTP